MESFLLCLSSLIRRATQERIDLPEDFNEIFGFDRIKSLMADREFIGKKWFQMLGKNKISYFVRIKEKDVADLELRMITIGSNN